MIARALLILTACCGAAIAQQAKQSSAPDSDGGIIYGDNWAFLANAPSGWQMTTHSDLPVNVAFFQSKPAEVISGRPPAMMYITVSMVGPETQNLDALIRQDEEDFRSESKSLKITQSPSIEGANNQTSVVRRFENTKGNRSELVAYRQYGNAMYEIVLSAPSPQSLDAHRSEFTYLVSKMSLMSISFENGAKPPSEQTKMPASAPQ